MALKLYERYPQLWDSPSNDYPQGAFKNLSAQGETDGSYLEQDWLNDYSGFFGALLRNAEMTPNGTIDTAQKSQFYDALVAAAKKAVGEEGYRKLDNNVFNGYLQVRSDQEGQGTGVFLQDTDGTVRGQVVATDQGLQLTQYPKDGGLQTFTFPNTGGEVATTSYVDAQIEAIPESDSTPVGTVQAYIGETAPNDKWLLCRGQAFSAESYPDLAQLLPALKIPDLRGVALRGLDANRGFDPSRELLSYQEDAMQKIEGRFNVSTQGSASGLLNLLEGAFSGESSVQAMNVAQSASSFSRYENATFDSSLVTRTNSQNETVMKNVAVNFIIKAR